MKPANYQQAEALSRQPEDLRRYLRARLVELTTLDGATAVRAVELLLTMAADDFQSDLSDVPDEQLRAARERASAYIRSNPGGEDGDTPDDGGTGAP